MALHLPRWATDCLKRHDPHLKSTTAPLVLYEKLNNAMRLVALNAEAETFGLIEGQALSDAKALCPGLIAREIDHGTMQALFDDMADWHANASPITAISADWTPYGDLLLDITGVAHLFAGEASMLKTLVGRLQHHGFSVQGAIAPSIGAAMALSHFAPGQIVDQDIETALKNLPTSALRLDEKILTGLNQMGLKRIGQLYGRDRQALLARFGPPLLTRLDQALDHIKERLIPRLPVPDRMATRKFAEPIGLIDDVLATITDLTHQLAGQLEAEGLGAQSFHLMLFRVDHKMMTLSVNAARATRDAAHIARLFANRIDRLTGDFDAGFGIDMIRLAATDTADLAPLQNTSFGITDGAADLDRLCDRLASRLGALTILRSKPINTHIPERAIVLEPMITRTPDDPEALPNPNLPRPLKLLTTPEAITVMAEIPDAPPARMTWRKQTYRFQKAAGPERIGVEWWLPGEDALTRDYYVCEDETGCRFWLFREGLYQSETATPRWFMHGLFA